MSFTKKFFAADDWGLSPAINEAILHLAHRGVLRAVSCLANAPYLTHGLEEILAYANDNDLNFSLHLNFTYGRPLSSPSQVASLVDSANGTFVSHPSLLRRSFLGRINKHHVFEELENQIQILRRLGIPLGAVDGHHHVHLLPGIAGAVQEALPKHGIYRMRVLADPRHPFSCLQTFLFKKFLYRKDSQIGLLPCLYLMPADLGSLESFRARLARIGGLPLLTHPALLNDFQSFGVEDSLSHYRVFEFQRICGYLDA